MLSSVRITLNITAVRNVGFEHELNDIPEKTQARSNN